MLDVDSLVMYDVNVHGRVERHIEPTNVDRGAKVVVELEG